MKKYIISLVSLCSAFTLSAQSTEESSTIFSSYGSSWLELDVGSSVYSASAGGHTESEAGASLSLEGNYSIYNLSDDAGVDLGLSFAYDEVEFLNEINVDSYTYLLELKPYLTLFKSNSLNVRISLNPFIGYAALDLDIKGLGKDDEDFLLIGLKGCVEVSFLEDFYASIAYKYSRVEAGSYLVDSFNMNEIEVVFAYRLTESLSFNIKYKHSFEQEFFDIIELSNDKVTAGVRYTF